MEKNPEVSTFITGDIINKNNVTLQCQFCPINDTTVKYEVRWYLGQNKEMVHKEDVSVHLFANEKAVSFLEPNQHKGKNLRDSVSIFIFS